MNTYEDDRELFIEFLYRLGSVATAEEIAECIENNTDNWYSPDYIERELLENPDSRVLIIKPTDDNPEEEYKFRPKKLQ